ncbi:MAG: hypothetical protein K0R38_5302 [Polyangiaceae bacterium]|jgi:hypothetical protein|nr:hypothetical protein [Polyangiaceae bacterium]
MTSPRALARSQGIVAAAAIALCAACVLVPSSAEGAAPKTGVVAGSGSTSGGVFTAGASGAEYLLPTQARLRLAPGAAVRMFPVPQQLQLAPGAKTTTYSFALLRGRVDVTVPAKPKSAVLCSLGKSSAVIGTGRAAILTRADDFTVASFEGDVRTLVSDRWQTLPPGTLSHVDGARASSPEPTLAAPKLAPGQRLWFSAGEPIEVSGFDFAKVERAAQYELRLRQGEGSAEQLRRVQSGTRLNEAFVGLTPGRYELALRSVDAEGIAGAWSAVEPVRVVGVSLPPGGYSSAGDIFIGKGQEVRFSNTEGLEMTYEGAGRYVPASEAVTLYRGETTVVSFRVRGSVYPTTARLRPRGVFAHVALGPSRAVWPKDSVQIVIELRSKDGEAVPQWLELKTDVKLGIEPVAVSFTRDGNRLIGAVPPPERPGPWVLRVEVKDQFGSLLGRDFLEIASGSTAAIAPAKTVSARVASK